MVKQLLKELLHLFYSNTCIVCHQNLLSTEHTICLNCSYSLPRTNNFLVNNNSAETLMAGRFPFERIATFCKFNSGGIIQPIIHDLKYKGNKQAGVKLGSLFGKDLVGSEFIKTIDYIVPVPLHSKKIKQRGYNQSEIISKGISLSTNIPVVSNNLIRKIHNPTQTKLSKSQRWENVEGIFDIINPDQFTNKHILLVDDIITTGSTIEASANAILKAKNTKISVATIGEAQ